MVDKPSRMRTFQVATTAAEIDRCFAVMRQLRPAVLAEEFAERIRAQQAEGYQLAYAELDGAVITCAGFRLQTMLWAGKTLYVDDLVTDSAMRSQGHGEAMLQWLVVLAREAGCSTFMLDSGTHRHEAHAFYFRQGLKITDFHFRLSL